MEQTSLCVSLFSSIWRETLKLGGLLILKQKFGSKLCIVSKLSSDSLLATL